MELWSKAQEGLEVEFACELEKSSNHLSMKFSHETEQRARPFCISLPPSLRVYLSVSVPVSISVYL